MILAAHGLAEGRAAWAYSVNSLFDLARSLCRYEDIVNLRDHHRSHRDIITFSNRHFYRGGLRIATDHEALKRPQKEGAAVRWIDLRGRVTRPPGGGALNTPEAELVQADVFEWRPAEQFGLVSFSFWLSHVPGERFDEFWGTVRDALAPGGRVFLVDSGAGDTAHTGTDQADGEETRSLADGRTFRIVKRRWAPAELAERVRPLGFELELRDTANGHFLYGVGALR